MSIRISAEDAGAGNKLVIVKIGEEEHKCVMTEAEYREFGANAIRSMAEGQAIAHQRKGQPNGA